MGIPLKKINNCFLKAGKLIVKYRWINIILFLAIITISVIGIKKIKKDASDDNWFVENDPMLLKQEEFEDIFGNNEFAAALIEVDDLFQPKVLEKIRELSNELEEYVPFADEVLSLTHFEYTLGTEFGMKIIDLVPEKIPEDHNELEKIRELALAKPGIVGKMISKECDQSWIMLRLTPYPDNWENNEEYHEYIRKTAKLYPKFFQNYNVNKPEAPELFVGHIFQQIVRQDKYASLNPKTAGMPMISYEKRIWTGKESPRLMLLALLVTIIVLSISLRSLRGVIFPVIASAGAMIIAFGVQGYIGAKIDPVMIPLPLFLGLAVSVGYSIHIFNFYKKEILSGNSPKIAAANSVGHAGWPLLFTALTTVGALMSFLFIKVAVLRWVGLTSAALVAITYILVIVLLPSMLSFGKQKMHLKKKKHSNTEQIMSKLNDFVMSNQTVIIVCFAIFSILCIYGLTKVEVSFDIKKTMGTNVPYVKRLDYIGNSKIGSLYSYNLGIEFPNPGDAKNPDNLRKFQTFENEIKQLHLTKKTSSLLDIVKDITQVLNSGSKDYYKIPEITDLDPEYLDNLTEEELKALDQQILSQTLLLYENAGGSEAEKWMDYDEQRLHLMVELRTYSSAELQRELKFIRQKAGELFPKARLIEAGMVIKYAAMQDIVALGQIQSFLIALAIIALLLMLVFGSIKTGLIGMIPNIAPALIVGGIMGFFDIPLDMITVTIMPMLLGLAVDDTIHFINHARLEYENDPEYDYSIKRTFITIGTPLFLTSLVLIANFSVYITSAAHIYSNLGLLAASGIAAALISDFFITPILLKKARVFGNNKKANINKMVS